MRSNHGHMQLGSTAYAAVRAVDRRPSPPGRSRSRPAGESYFPDTERRHRLQHRCERSRCSGGRDRREPARRPLRRGHQLRQAEHGRRRTTSIVTDDITSPRTPATRPDPTRTRSTSWPAPTCATTTRCSCVDQTAADINATIAGWCPNDITGLYTGGMLESNGTCHTHPAMQYTNINGTGARTHRRGACSRCPVHSSPTTTTAESALGNADGERRYLPVAPWRQRHAVGVTGSATRPVPATACSTTTSTSSTPNLPYAPPATGGSNQPRVERRQHLGGFVMTPVPWPVLALIALLGLAIGSFLNVVIYRVPRGESIALPGLALPALQRRDQVPPQRSGPGLADATWTVRVLRTADQLALPAGRGDHRGADGHGRDARGADNRVAGLPVLRRRRDHPGDDRRRPTSRAGLTRRVGLCRHRPTSRARRLRRPRTGWQPPGCWSAYSRSPPPHSRFSSRYRTWSSWPTSRWPGCSASSSAGCRGRRSRSAPSPSCSPWRHWHRPTVDQLILDVEHGMTVPPLPAPHRRSTPCPH